MTTSKQPPRRPTVTHRHEEQVLLFAKILFSLGVSSFIIGMWAVLAGWAPFAGLVPVLFGSVLSVAAMMSRTLNDFSLAAKGFRARMRGR